MRVWERLDVLPALATRNSSYWGQVWNIAFTSVRRTKLELRLSSDKDRKEKGIRKTELNVIGLWCDGTRRPGEQVVSFAPSQLARVKAVSAAPLLVRLLAQEG